MNAKINVRWNKRVKIITIVVAILLISVEINLISNLMHRGYINIFAIIIILIALLFCICNAPMSIELSNHQFILKKCIGRITINYNEICNIMPNKRLGISDIRIFGSGGFGGYIGIFYNTEIGRYYAFVGDPNQVFLIKTKRGRIFAFSSENSSSVVETIKRNIQ